MGFQNKFVHFYLLKFFPQTLYLSWSFGGFCVNFVYARFKKKKKKEKNKPKNCVKSTNQIQYNSP